MNFSFIRGEIKFFEYFEKASENLVQGANLLQALLENLENVQDQVAQIQEVEHQGDFIVHEVTNLLPRTLITPIDPDDIQHLVSSIDDALDAIQAAAVRLEIYQVTDARKPARRLAQVIVESAQELDKAVHMLRDKKSYARAREHIVQINTLENTGDRIFQDGLSRLVEQRGDMFDFIRWKEIYELLEQTTDRIEDAGDVLQRVMFANG